MVTFLNPKLRTMLLSFNISCLIMVSIGLHSQAQTINQLNNENKAIAISENSSSNNAVRFIQDDYQYKNHSQNKSILENVDGQNNSLNSLLILHALPPTSYECFGAYTGYIGPGDVVLPRRLFKFGNVTNCVFVPVCSGITGIGSYYADIFYFINPAPRPVCMTLNGYINDNSNVICATAVLNDWNMNDPCQNLLVDSGFGWIGVGNFKFFDFFAPANSTFAVVFYTFGSGVYVNSYGFSFSANNVICGWNTTSIGQNCSNNTTYHPSTEIFTVTSTNCYYPNSFTSDQLAFAQYDLCGDGSITARVTSITPLAQGWAGVTMRESNAAGAKKAQLMTNLSNFSRREFRTTTNGQAYPQQFPSQNRYWLRITRMGNQFVMYVSLNGTAWSFAGAQNIIMGSCIEMGLVVTNYNPNSTVTATFGNVTVTGGSINRPAINTQEDILGAADFSILPNPTNGLIEVDLGSYGQRKVQLDLYNMQGKLLRSANIETIRKKEEIDLTSFANGMYLITVRAEGLPDVAKRVVLNSNQ